MKRILVIGAAGQIGSELTPALCQKYGGDNVIAGCHKKKPDENLLNLCSFEYLDCLNAKKLEAVIKKYDIGRIYHLAAILSAVAESNPHLAWDININGLYTVLEAARKYGCSVFTPSSIGAFGLSTPSDNTPQDTIQRPNTMYGVTKVAGELLCDYYFKRFGVDTRGVRYPGIISNVTLPGGGTTDYAVHMFYEALEKKRYTCYIKKGTYLDMMYMPDAIKAAIDLMEADSSKLKHRNAFNVAAMSFEPEELAAEIKKHIPEFTMDYKIDPVRQAIAESWPNKMDDLCAREEWGWYPEYDLLKMAQDMIKILSKRLCEKNSQGKEKIGMSKKIKEDLEKTLEELKKQGTYKTERIITTAQGVEIRTSEGKKVLNFCSNNYLGLANNHYLINAAQKTMKKWGYGLSSVRFICGTQKIHKQLEKKVSEFLGTEDTILYAACFDANTGLFEALLGEQDVIITDELNHASIIDGVRMCKARRLIYKHSEMRDICVDEGGGKFSRGLEYCLRITQDCRYRIIATDGVFSMDGDIAKIKEICDLADKYDALVMVDDSHATGYIGKTGRGTPEHCGAVGRVDVITTTFGKALGGASGGCTSGRKEIIEMLRQRSRPYLFSNTLAPAIVGASIKALNMLIESSNLRDKVMENAAYFRKKMTDAGFDIVAGETAIVPAMLYSEPLAVKMADMLLKEGIYVIGFTYPVVPKGKARIRVQLSAAHSIADLDKAIRAFVKIGKELGVIKNVWVDKNI